MYKRYLAGILLWAVLLPPAGYAQTCTNTAMAESTPTAGFEFHPDGTVTHQATGLTWKRCLEGQTFADNSTADTYLDDRCTGSALWMSWQAALDWAQDLNTGSGFAGHADWRLPNAKELASIVEYCRLDPAINTEVFPGGESAYIWSSSPVVNSPDNPHESWDINFGDGDGGWDARRGGHLVHLVRVVPVTSWFCCRCCLKYSRIFCSPISAKKRVECMIFFSPACNSCGVQGSPRHFSPIGSRTGGKIAVPKANGVNK